MPIQPRPSSADRGELTTRTVDSDSGRLYLDAMDLKKLLTSQGLKLMQDPRFAKLMQDERVMKTMMQASQARSKAQESFDETVENVAKRLGLVTKKEVRELKRGMRKLESELKKARKTAEEAKQAASARDDEKDDE